MQIITVTYLCDFCLKDGKEIVAKWGWESKRRVGHTCDDCKDKTRDIALRLWPVIPHRVINGAEA